MPKLNMIRLHATPGRGAELGSFLRAGAQLVDKGEPNTQRWYALAREGRSDEFAIFDLFPDQAGRQAHFDGQVAAALADKATDLVRDGWDGVLGNNTNFAGLAAHEADHGAVVQKATYVKLAAAPGKAAALAEFLTKGRDLVAQTEPGTLYWVALHSEDQADQFAIFDLFADAQGRAAHFDGVVAKALSERADELVAGGWDQGVLANVVHFDVIANVRRDR